MIEALFNQPDYLAAKKTLDAVALRHEAIASNIANVETPGYRRIDLATHWRPIRRPWRKASTATR
jgi:flagellar basal-body rod protein FlgB